MSYSIKWVEENLGITREMIRHYEDKKLLSKSKARNPINGYRSYSEEDIEKIWNIKLLIGIGFSTKEIYALMNDYEYDFDTAIAKKVKELEKKHDEIVIFLEFAKSIKALGRIPTASKLGNCKFDEFLQYTRKIWNFYDDPRSATFMKGVDTLISKEPHNWSAEETERILQILESLDADEMRNNYTLHGYYQLLSDLQEFSYDSEIVQKVVKLLHNHIIENNTIPELDGKITEEFFAKQTAPCFIAGDISTQFESNYGKNACIFIAKAITHYGGYNLEI